MIQAPISLNEIKTKVNKGLYGDDPESFVADFELMKDNAQSFNEKDSVIFNDSELISDFVREKIDEWKRGNDEQEKLEYFEAVKRVMMMAIDDAVNYKSRGRHPSELFMDIPSKEDYPDYHDIIKTPMAFNDLRDEVENGEIKTFDTFTERAMLIFTNARLYNEEESLVYHDSLALEKKFFEKLEKAKKTLKISEPDGYLEWATAQQEDDNDSGREVTPKTKVKLNLKKRQEERDVEEDVELETDHKTNRGGGDDDEDTSMADANNEDEGEQTPKNNDNDGEDVAAAAGEVAADDDEVHEKYLQSVVDEKRLRGPNETLENDALIKKVNITSVIPAISKYHQNKSQQQGGNSSLPLSGKDLFQLIIPASKTHTVQSFAFTVPNYHHVLHVHSYLHEALNSRQHNYSIFQNGRRIQPITSSTTNPWADVEKPIYHKSEIRLTPGLNQIEFKASAMTSEEAYQFERYTLWVNLAR